MKSILSIAFAALIGALPTVQIPGAASQTWTGEISSNNCEVAYMPGMSAGDFTRECVVQGSDYVLLSADGRAYTFADQADRTLRAHAGERVTVTGELEGNVIKTAKILVAQ